MSIACTYWGQLQIWHTGDCSHAPPAVRCVVATHIRMSMAGGQEPPMLRVKFVCAYAQGLEPIGGATHRELLAAPFAFEREPPRSLRRQALRSCQLIPTHRRHLSSAISHATSAGYECCTCMLPSKRIAGVRHASGMFSTHVCLDSCGRLHAAAPLRERAESLAGSWSVYPPSCPGLPATRLPAARPMSTAAIGSSQQRHATLRSCPQTRQSAHDQDRRACQINL